jgi:hypothetical protein
VSRDWNSSSVDWEASRKAGAFVMDITLRSLRIGERVRIHPASDWFMRGVTQGIITAKRLRGETVIHYVRPDTAGIAAPAKLRMKLTRDLLIAEGDD